jgi:hypothetical protein
MSGEADYDRFGNLDQSSTYVYQYHTYLLPSTQSLVVGVLEEASLLYTKRVLCGRAREPHGWEAAK